MPPKFPWSKSNRALHSVDRLDSPPSESIGAAGSAAPDEPARTGDHADRPPGPPQPAPPPSATAPPPVAPVAVAVTVAQGQHREQYPQRTASKAHRLSAALAQDSHAPPAQHPTGPSSPALAPGAKKQSLSSRIAAGVRGHKKDDAARHAHKNGVGVARSQSLRAGGDPRAHEQPSLLPPSHELDEDHFDPFLQQADDSTSTRGSTSTSTSTPQVPLKDTLYQQAHAHAHNHAHYTSNPLQDHYARPPLDSVSTAGSFHTQGGVEHYSPDQPQGQGPLQPQPSQPYQSYQPTLQHPQNQSAHEYQAFHPQATSISLPYDAQLHGQDEYDRQDEDLAQHQQDRYQYPSQHQVTREHAQQPQQPQQLRPPSSHLQHAPPSPLQSQTHPSHDTPTQHASYATEPQTHSITPPEDGQDNMAAQGQGSGRNTLRKANDGGQPGAPTRESSLLQQPSSAQGQHHGPPPGSPGLASFDANVVPTASQGQPYRGEKQNQQGQGEMGRATPPPRTSASDVTDEEIEKMIKDHDVLREKYQKVKRYFFEQQSQVHQLQNTLANQRLSVSRTSWDDSEYATRFNRLDGLIAQLSFTIRKDWRMIPQWLQVVVNKTAVETGKQEMTAVGRAFMSNWLVENIFDKYFHPDLEPGFSTQLQSIVANIRKFSPPCHSIEDEESLAAKIINWRLATLEGLADTLRGPQAEMYRQQLTNTLNEKLIASLQMHLNDPAPPDLAGGVPMIIELAISIAQHLPLESREVHIEYFPPGHAIIPESMKMETTIPALTAPIMELDEADRASLRSVASRVEDGAPIADQDQMAQPKEDKKRGMFSFGVSKKPIAAPATFGKRESSLGQGSESQPPGSSGAAKEETAAARVRLAAGLAVQIRGKSILIKAPVYST